MRRQCQHSVAAQAPTGQDPGLSVAATPAVPWTVGVRETGTRTLLGAVFGPPATRETDYARRPLGLLEPDVLVLTDAAGEGHHVIPRVTLGQQSHA